MNCKVKEPIYFEIGSIKIAADDLEKQISRFNNLTDLINKKIIPVISKRVIKIIPKEVVSVRLPDGKEDAESWLMYTIERTKNGGKSINMIRGEKKKSKFRLVYVVTNNRDPVKARVISPVHSTKLFITSKDVSKIYEIITMYDYVDLVESMIVEAIRFEVPSEVRSEWYKEFKKL